MFRTHFCLKDGLTGRIQWWVCGWVLGHLPLAAVRLYTSLSDLGMTWLCWDLGAATACSNSTEKVLVYYRLRCMTEAQHGCLSFFHTLVFVTTDLVDSTIAVARNHIFEYKCNNTEDVDTVFWKFNFWPHRESVESGRVRENELVDLSANIIIW